MHRHFVGLMAALALFTGSAIADGMNTRGSIKDSVQPFSWRGFYVGLHAGLATGNTQGDVPVFDEFSLRTDYELNGALYGAQAGWLGQWGNIVAGVEGTYSGTNIQGSNACVAILECQRSIDWIATAVGRAGLAYDRILLYGLAGIAWADVDTNVGIVGFPLVSANETHVGWTVGFGVEWALSDRVSARIEYAHIDLGSETHNLSFAGGGGESLRLEGGSISDKVKLEMDTIRLGVNVKLGN
jgi:outer membrane immunogenic protein